MTELVRTQQGEIYRPPAGQEIEVGRTICAFLDTATTSFGRATHYNTKQEQQAAELKAHRELFNLERDIYTILLTLQGVTDRSRQIGMKTLLSHSRNGVTGILTPGSEREVLYQMIRSLPVPRMLKMIDGLRVGNEELGLKKANNARTRKLILRSLLSSKSLQLWAVKYRSKMRMALTHAWGERKTGVIRSILSKDKWTPKEQSIVRHNLDRYAGDHVITTRECAAFILGSPCQWNLPLFKAFVAAKDDLKAGAKLPLEVLEGIRSTYHKDVSKEEALKLVATTGTLTTHQKMTVQKRAKAAGVEVEMDPTKYDAVRLYLYAFECGLSPEVTAALDKKAKKAANIFPAKYDRLGIIVDASASMYGDRTQALRPMAATLAMRDMLKHTSKQVHITYAGGACADLVRPEGETDLASGLLEVLESMPDAVFVLSDGYENAPAGRFNEVIQAIREIGIQTPVYHINPVYAAEAGSIRSLSPDVPAMPVQTPAAIGTTFLRGLIEAEPVRGINTLLRRAIESGPLRKELSHAPTEH